MTTSSPIADLSYRGYDGPLAPPTLRWWVIARMSIRLTVKKKGFWALTLLAGGYYVLMMIVLFFMEQQAAATLQGKAALDGFLKQIVWKDQFMHGFSMGQIWFVLIAMLLGAGAIANDNRANALLVYLSKPCDKVDYLIGKWVGIWVPMAAAMLMPTLLFFLYGAMSYRESGFLSSDPWALPKMVVVIAIASGFYASLIIGISSMFRQGRIAGATMAGLYFISNFFTQMMFMTWTMSERGMGRGPGSGAETVPPAIKTLYYASVDGINIGLSKAILGTNGTGAFGVRAGREPYPPAPSLWLVLLVIVGISALAMAVAWRRVRAVEVVG